MLDEDTGTIEISTTVVNNKKNNIKQNAQTKKNTAINNSIINNQENKNISGMKIRELELKDVTVRENKTIHVSISDPGWIINSFKPKDTISIIGREDLEKNTVFELMTIKSGKAEIIFTR